VTKEDNKGKYLVPNSESEGEVLNNKQGLTKKAEVDEAEFIGFLMAQNHLIEELSEETTFDLDYLYKIHEIALGDLYGFAGTLRTVNMSKGGFVFPSAQFLPNAMETFEKDMLLKMSEPFESRSEFIKALASSHAELLYIHPFREGNGRTARLLANLISFKYFQKDINFIDILRNKKDLYIKAVQQSANQDYSLMEELISEGLG